MSSVRPNADMKLDPKHFAKEKRLNKEKFLVAYRGYLKKTILSKFPDQCQSPAANEVAEQAWQDYAMVCDSFDKKRVAKVNRGAIPFSGNFSDDIPLYYLDPGLYITNIDIGCYFHYFFIRNINDKKKLQALSTEDKKKIKAIFNLPRYYWGGRGEGSVDGEIISRGASLMSYTSNSYHTHALTLINFGVEVNHYNAYEGNTALLLAVSKGWNHQDSEGFTFFSLEYPQREIIKSLLDHNANVNAIHLANGMTPLHIACLRGDDPELIYLLLKKGARLDAKDYTGRTPADLLTLSYEQAQQIINPLTMTRSDHHLIKTHGFGEEKQSENKSWTATLPTRSERKKNQEVIKKMLVYFQELSESKIDITLDQIKIMYQNNASVMIATRGLFSDTGMTAKDALLKLQQRVASGKTTGASSKTLAEVKSKYMQRS